jgi:hypothetical protein
MQKEIAYQMTNKSQGIADNKVFLSTLTKYEELNLTIYVEGDKDKMVLASGGEDEDNAHKEAVKELEANLKNPYFNLYHWIKGEVSDIEALLKAIQTKDSFASKIKKSDLKKRNTQKDLDNVTQGKKTVGTLFKNEGDSAKMVSKIENTDKEIESLNVLSDVMTIYLGESVIPPFKEKRINLYHKIIAQFNVLMINNAH